MENHNNVADALAEEIRRRESELSVLKQAYLILAITPERVSEQPLSEPEPLPVQTPPPVPEPPSTAVRRRTGKSRQPAVKSMAKSANSMEFMRAWARNHDGMVNTMDVAGAIMPRQDLNPDGLKARDLARVLTRRLHVYKEFSSVGDGVFRWAKHQTDANAVEPAAAEKCNRCGGDLRERAWHDGAGNTGVATQCVQCGHDHNPAAMEVTAA